MEGSKAFSKDFMARHNIPTAAYRNFTDHAAAVEYVKSVDHSVVIKASGLAAGKGVIIPTTTEEAVAALNDIMVNKEFGSAGEEVVVEEFLTGQEISILAFSDGYTALALPGAQDHKRIGEGDTGPNTGGMGTYSPAPCSTKEVEAEILKTVVQPTIDGMRKDGKWGRAERCRCRIRTDWRHGAPLLPDRYSFRWNALHWYHAHTERTQGLGVQRALR